MANDTLTEVRFWLQVVGDAKRTILCPPDLESRIKGWVDARGMGGIITVIASRMCPNGQVLIVDTPALEAASGAGVWNTRRRPNSAGGSM